MATISPPPKIQGGICHEVTLVYDTRVRLVTPPLTLGEAATSFSAELVCLCSSSGSTHQPTETPSRTGWQESKLHLHSKPRGNCRHWAREDTGRVHAAQLLAGLSGCVRRAGAGGEVVPQRVADASVVTGVGLSRQ